MPPSPPPFSLTVDPRELHDAVAQAQANDDLMAELAEIYAALDTEIAALDVHCFGSGACCRFDQAGHRLYLSTAELAYLLSQAPLPAAVRLGRCPYQLGPRCQNRLGRPIGCRIYFCDINLQESLNDIYAKYHARLRHCHERISLPYHYVELSIALAALAEFRA
jgi:hypothetical protein